MTFTIIARIVLLVLHGCIWQMILIIFVQGLDVGSADDAQKTFSEF